MTKILSGAFIFLIFPALNHAAPGSESYWINPPQGGNAPPQLTWIVGEQHNLSWFTLGHGMYNISFVQEVVPSSNDHVVIIYGNIYLSI